MGSWPERPDQDLAQMAQSGIDPNHLVDEKVGQTQRKTVKVPVYICADHLHLFAWSCDLLLRVLLFFFGFT